MADKKQTHETWIAEIERCTKALEAAQSGYKAFCKENPLEVGKQPTVHELRRMREKLSKDKPEDFVKANAAAKEAAQKAALAEQIKSGE